MLERIYDAFMKGPPRWFYKTAVVLVILLIGVQSGMWKERSTQTAAAIKEQLDKKEATIDRLTINLNNVSYDLAVEQEKLAILLCESGIKHEGQWGDGGKSFGIAQFQKATFNDLKKAAGRPELQWKVRADQLWLLDWALRHGYGRYWTCFSKEGTGGQI